MKITQLLASLAALVTASGATLAQVKASVECISSGTKSNGSKASKAFIERIQVERWKKTMPGKDGKPEEWGFSKADLISDGEKQKPTLVTATIDYAVLANAITVGTGFERRLLVFTYMLDLRAMQLTRIVNSLPIAPEERTTAACTPK